VSTPNEATAYAGRKEGKKRIDGNSVMQASVRATLRMDHRAGPDTWTRTADGRGNQRMLA
jgi:hypothetical protein